MSQIFRPSPVWFDTEQGVLIAATVHELRPLTSKPHIRKLGELLCAEEFPYRSGDFEQIIPTDDWGYDECKKFGGWMLRELAPYTAKETPDHRLTQPHLRRARILGIGPAPGRIENIFGTLADYREALGIHSGRSRTKYKEWSRQHFARYAAKVASGVDGRPRRQDYIEAQKAWDGPSLKIIDRYAGGFGQLNELIGYPDIYRWDREDFIQWGTDVMRANDEAHPGFNLVKELCRRQAGPSVTTISKYFDGLRPFQSLVIQRRQEQVEEYVEHRDTQLRWAKENMDEESLAIVEELPEHKQLAFIGRYQTAQECLSRLGHATFRRLAAEPGTFISQVLSLNKRAGFTAGNIEETAIILGVFDDIWPPEEYLKRLRVEESGIARQKPRSRNETTREKPSQKAA